MAHRMQLPANHNDTSECFVRRADERGYLEVSRPRRSLAEVGSVVIGCVLALLALGGLVVRMFSN